MTHFPAPCRCQLIPSRQSSCRDQERRGTNTSYDVHRFIEIGEINAFLEVINFSARIHKVSEQCIDLLLHIICLGLEHPCNPESNLPVLICEENCRIYQRIQAAQICHVIDEQILELTIVNPENALTKAYFTFDCTDPSTYSIENITEADPDICTHLFSAKAEGKSRLVYSCSFTL